MNIPSAPYHAGLSQAERNKAHRQFINDQIQVRNTKIILYNGKDNFQKCLKDI